MSQNPALNREEGALEKQKALLERAQKGVLQFLKDKGGKLALSDLHNFSLNKYLIQHQAFSRLMETLVDEKLVEYDYQVDVTTLTDKGRAYISS